MECLCNAQIGQHHKTSLLMDRCKDDNIPQTTRYEVRKCDAFNASDFAKPVDQAQLNRNKRHQGACIVFFHLHCLHDRDRRSRQAVHYHSQQQRCQQAADHSEFFSKNRQQQGRADPDHDAEGSGEQECHGGRAANSMAGGLKLAAIVVPGTAGNYGNVENT